jgi:uncharacterized protein (TIGR00369 family)
MCARIRLFSDQERAMFSASDPLFEQRVRDSFSRQGALTLIGASLTRVEPGIVDISLSHRSDLTQQHGFLHAGIVGTIVDSAGGYAGFTLFPADSSVLTVEYKLNLIAPADGESFVAEGRVVKPGRTLCVTQGEVYAVKGGSRSLCALMQQTLIVMQGRSDNTLRRVQ